MALQISGQSLKTQAPGQPFPQDQQGALVASELNSRYYLNAYAGNAYFLSVPAAAGTAYVGAAGGTPLLAIFNPPGSGKNLVLKTAAAGVVAAGSAAGQTPFRLYAGPSVIPGGTIVVPTSILSYQKSGSVAVGVSNAAMTNSTALTYVITLGTYYFSPQLTSGGPTAFLAPPLIWDAAGQIIVVPGNMLALGAASIPTSMTNDATLIWDELPI
jgi:hypothetical protein